MGDVLTFDLWQLSRLPMNRKLWIDESIVSFLVPAPLLLVSSFSIGCWINAALFNALTEGAIQFSILMARDKLFSFFFFIFSLLLIHFIYYFVQDWQPAATNCHFVSLYFGSRNFFFVIYENGWRLKLEKSVTFGSNKSLFGLGCPLLTSSFQFSKPNFECKPFQ